MNILRLALLSLAAVIALSLGIHWLVEASRMDETASAPAALLDEKHGLSDEATAALRGNIEAKLAEIAGLRAFFRSFETGPAERI